MSKDQRAVVRKLGILTPVQIEENVLPLRNKEVRTDNGHEFQGKFRWHGEDRGIRHVSIKRGTPQLSGKSLSSDLIRRSNAHIDPIDRSSTSSSATRVALIWRPNAMNGNASTTSPDHIAPATAKRLTRPCGRSNSHTTRCPARSRWFQIA